MIFPLASQPGIEVKAVHRSQDPERDGIASSTSQREGGGESVLGSATPAVVQDGHSGKGGGGGRGGESLRDAPSPPRASVLGGGGRPCWPVCPPT